MCMLWALFTVDGSVVPDEIFDESTASNKSQSSSSAMHVRRKGIPFREERFRQPGENDSGLVRMWKEGASEANNAVLDAIIMYVRSGANLLLLLPIQHRYKERMKPVPEGGRAYDTVPPMPLFHADTFSTSSGLEWCLGLVLI